MKAHKESKRGATRNFLHLPLSSRHVGHGVIKREQLGCSFRLDYGGPVVFSEP